MRATQNQAPTYSPMLDFGKHRGELLCDVELDYLEWMASKPSGKAILRDGADWSDLATKEIARRNSGGSVDLPATDIWNAPAFQPKAFLVNTAAGSFTLTTVGSVFFSKEDIGRELTVMGAGSLTTDLHTTIMEVYSPSAVRLKDAPWNTLSNATAIWPNAASIPTIPLSTTPKTVDEEPSAADSFNVTVKALDALVDKKLKEFILRVDKKQNLSTWAITMAKEAIRYGTKSATVVTGHRVYRYQGLSYLIIRKDEDLSELTSVMEPEILPEDMSQTLVTSALTQA